MDFIANPSTANTAPKVYPGDEINGALKTVETLKGAHYTKMGNLLGIPSVSIPTGYNDIGLPTSIMFQAKWVSEFNDETNILCYLSLTNMICSISHKEQKNCSNTKSLRFSTTICEDLCSVQIIPKF